MHQLQQTGSAKADKWDRLDYSCVWNRSDELHDILNFFFLVVGFFFFTK